MGRSFLSIGCLSRNFSNISSGSIGDIDGPSDGQCEGCGVGTSAAPQGRKCQGLGSSSTAVELETAKEATTGKYFGVFLLSKKLFQTSSVASQFSFQERWGWTFLFPLFLHSSETRRTCVLSDGPLYLFDPCRLGLFLAYCAKGSNRSNLPWIRMPRCLGGRLHHICMGMQTGLQISHASLQTVFRILGFGISSSCSFSTTTKSSSVSGASSHQEYWACQERIPRGYRWHAVRACSPMGASASGGAQDERQEVVALLQRQEDPSRHALRGVQGMGRQRVCRCAGAAHLAGRAGCLEDCQCGSRRKILVLSVSHVLDRGRFEREFHKELVPSCMVPYVGSWSLFIKSGRRPRSGRN